MNQILNFYFCHPCLTNHKPFYVKTFLTVQSNTEACFHRKDKESKEWSVVKYNYHFKTY